MRPISPLTLVIHRTAAQQQRGPLHAAHSVTRCVHEDLQPPLPGPSWQAGQVLRSFSCQTASAIAWAKCQGLPCKWVGPRGASAIRSAQSIRRSPRWRHPSVPSTGTGFNQWFCFAPRLIFAFGRSRVKLSARDSWANPSGQRSSSGLSCDACSCFRSCRISAQ